MYVLGKQKKGTYEKRGKQKKRSAAWRKARNRQMNINYLKFPDLSYWLTIHPEE
jgi:hypothetical protein